MTPEAGPMSARAAAARPVSTSDSAGEERIPLVRPA
jgi:hypothetical protein